MKGFVGWIALALVTTSLSVISLLALSLENYQQNNLYEIQAAKVADRFGDAQNFFESTFDDAIVDSAYSYGGCNASGDFCAIFNSTLTSYFSNSTSVLSDNITNVSVSSLSENCTEVSAENYSVSVNFSLLVNSFNASKSADLSFSRNVSITNYSAAVYNDSTTDVICANETLFNVLDEKTSGEMVANISVNCSKPAVSGSC